MKKLITGLMFALCAVGAQAQFISGQVLTAAQLNAQFALYLPLSGGTITGPLTVNGLLTATGNIGLGSLAFQSPNTVVANIAAMNASPTAVTLPSCSTSASALNYANGTGFSCNTAINAAQLGGATFAAPAAIGSTTPNTGAFTTLSTTGLATLNSVSTGNATVSGGSINGTPVGATTASTGAFTTLSASSTVSGAGFTARFATPGPIGNTTASTGAFTTITASSTITPSSTAGIVGTTTNDSANAGSVGEYQNNATSGTSLTTSTAANATSVSLTAGDWDVSGVVRFNPGGSSTISNMTVGISTTSATFGTVPNTVQALLIPFTGASGNNQTLATPTVRISIAATTTVYLVALSTFSASTMTADGFIRARRVR